MLRAGDLEMATPSESGADGDRIGTKRCSSTQGETEIHASLERSDSIAVGKRLSHTYTHTHTHTHTLRQRWL